MRACGRRSCATSTWRFGNVVDVVVVVDVFVDVVILVVVLQKVIPRLPISISKKKGEACRDHREKMTSGKGESEG